MIEIGLGLWFAEEPGTIFKFRSLPLLECLLFRHLLETLDLLYNAFALRRTGTDWAKELAKIKKWLQRDERDRLSAIG